MEAVLGGIKLDWCKIGDIDYNSEVTEKPLEDASQSSLATNIENNFMNFSIQIKLTKDDKEQKYEKIKKIREQKKIIKLNYYRSFNNLVIENITETINSTNLIELNIKLKQINFANLQTVIIQDPDLPDTLNSTTAGKQGFDPLNETLQERFSYKKTIPFLDDGF